MPFEHPFYFLRHGESEWNEIKKTQGQSDSRLNDKGRMQAKRAGEVMRQEPIERIVTSPLMRVRDTAAAVAAHHDVPMTFDDELMEAHLGDWQGKPWGDHLALYWSGKSEPPGGETFPQFAARAWKAMERAVTLGPNTLIVAHGGLWRAAQVYVGLEPDLPSMPNALPIKVTPGESSWQVEILGE